MKKQPVVMSWSGGKDSAIALDELLRNDAYEVVVLLTTVSEEFRRISHHGVRESVLDDQAESIGIPLQKVYLPSSSKGGCTNEVYESIMNEAMLAFFRAGIRIVAFGDLFLQDLREWREANLAKVKMDAIFPVWHRPTAKFARDVITLGYKARLSCAEARLGESFAGREYDKDLLRDLPSNSDPCGENGEFHTFVYDGPIFHQPVAVSVGEIVERGGRYFADLIGGNGKD